MSGVKTEDAHKTYGVTRLYRSSAPHLKPEYTPLGLGVKMLTWHRPPTVA